MGETSCTGTQNQERKPEDPRRLVKGYAKQNLDSLFKAPYSVRQLKIALKNDMLLRRSHFFDGWIPTQIVTPEEKYMRKCLELIHIDSSKPSSCALSYNMNWNSPIDDASLMVFGTIMDTQPIKTLINSTLLHNSLTKLAHPLLSKPLIKPLSISSCYTRATLQCAWKDKNPHFIFSLENPKSLFLATLSNHPTECAYVFYSGHRISPLESKANLVGKMVVSSSSSLSSHVTVLDREFVLFSDSDASCVSGGLGTNLAEPNLSANYELAAVVVRERLSAGGWGLKFLKNIETDECSTCIDVIVPAGVHGGPEGGPYSLIERWRSGGCCDCGGWDVGCSLTLYNDRTNGRRDSTFCELFDRGFSECLPVLKVVAAQEGLYLVNFQANFSSLQAFAIVVAHIHSQSEVLRPNLYSR